MQEACCGDTFASSDDVAVSLANMAIGSVDSLRGLETAQSIPPTWNDQPPLLTTGPRDGLEDVVLLKGVRILFNIYSISARRCMMHAPRLVPLQCVTHSLTHLSLILSIIIIRLFAAAFPPHCGAPFGCPTWCRPCTRTKARNIGTSIAPSPRCARWTMPTTGSCKVSWRAMTLVRIQR